MQETRARLPRVSTPCQDEVGMDVMLAIASDATDYRAFSWSVRPNKTH